MWLVLVLVLVAVCLLGDSFLGIVEAVDRSKFRTCAQTSFCRRNRGRKGPGYRIVSSSVRFGIEEEEDSDGSFKPPGDRNDNDESSDSSDSSSSQNNNNGEEAGWWSSLFHRTTNGDSSSSSSSSLMNMKMVTVGPPPVWRALLETHGQTPLEATVHLHDDGTARFRVVEMISASSSSSVRNVRNVPRWTSDALVLTELAQGFVEEDRGVVHYPLGQVPSEWSDARMISPDVCSALVYHDGRAAILFRHDQFQLHLLLRQQRTGSDDRIVPLISLNARDMLYFEQRRRRPGEDNEDNEEVPKVDDTDDPTGEMGGFHDDNVDDVEKTDDDTDTTGTGSGTSEETSEETSKKEVVGYWEDGKAIYSDGTRDDDVATVVEEDVNRNRPQRSQQEEEEGLWEESFGSHKDSKPHGPMSVGMDVSFPSSRHVYGIPEHATKFSLERTTGPNAHYKEPYRLYNLDVFEYELDEPMALYGSIPLLVSHRRMSDDDGSSVTAGVFWFNPTETFVDVFDVNDDNNDNNNDDKHSTVSSHWMSESGVLDLFLLSGDLGASRDVDVDLDVDLDVNLNGGVSGLYRQYMHLTGRPYMPPAFALGYHQCRWNYRDIADVRNIHAHFEQYDYPYDVLWLDIEHTDGKRYFTWDSAHFPYPEQQHMIEELAAQGRKMVTIVDPHLKRDKGYSVYKEASQKKLLVRQSDGKEEYDGWCWPGSSAYPDFLSSEVRAWWASQFAYDKYKGSTPDLYTWNDMNEPSVFNGPEVTMSKDLVNTAGIEHREWHNLYGMVYHRATFEGQLLRSGNTDDRPFVLSRSFFAGSQKYGPIWTGDNTAEWSHLEIAVPMLLSLSVAGLPFVGADVGGFFGNPDAELLVRWNQAAAYQPFFRGHAHHDSPRREPWVHGPVVLRQMRDATMARYALLPYWQTLFYEAHCTGLPMMRPLWMEFSDQIENESQFMVGSALMVAPVTEAGATVRDVVFPSWKGGPWYDATTLRVVVPPRSTTVVIPVDAPIDKIPVFQRAGTVIPRRLRLRRSASLMAADPLTLYVAVGFHYASEDVDKSEDVDVIKVFAKGSLYLDDGRGPAEDGLVRGRIAKFQFDGTTLHNTINNNNDKNNNDNNNDDDDMESLVRGFEVERILVFGLHQLPYEIEVVVEDGSYDPTTGILVVPVRTPRLSAALPWSLRILGGGPSLTNQA